MGKMAFLGRMGGLAKRYAGVVWFVLVLFSSKANAATVSFEIIATLTSIQDVLARVGPVMSAILFIVAGIFYAIGQMLPATKRATYHSTAIDILIGAIIVAVLSVASSSLALASTRLLVNSSSSLV